MYERFTDRARKVMQLANQDAQRWNHDHIGTEHILLGLVAEGSGVALHVLRNLDVDQNAIRIETEKLWRPPGPAMVTKRKISQTPGSKKVIEYALQEARSLSHNYIGTEHLLLGLLREQEGVAAQVMLNVGLKLDEVRAEVANMLGCRVPSSASGAIENESNTGSAPQPTRMRIVRTTSKILFVVIGVFVAAGFLRWVCCGRDTVQQVAFDSAAWQRADPIEDHRTVRSQMIEDLLRHYKFQGWTRQQLVSLLGEPTREEPAKMGFPQWDAVYILGLERSGALAIDDEALGFKFDSSDKVASYGLSVN